MLQPESFYAFRIHALISRANGSFEKPVWIFFIVKKTTQNYPSGLNKTRFAAATNEGIKPFFLSPVSRVSHGQVQVNKAACRVKLLVGPPGAA